MKPVAQTLHGYRDGHRELARFGDLDNSEGSLLDRLSDLSGYIPTGHEFDHYVSGFPCGRYYALAATWPDKLAPRSGAVLTHTVLFEQQSTRLELLEELSRWLIRPSSIRDAQRYEERPSAPTTAWFGGAEPESVCLRAIVRRFFSRPQRPVLWIDDASSEDTVARLWAMLPAADQRSFAFCTMALGDRTLRQRPFDLLVVPSSARARVLGVTDREAVFEYELDAEQELGPMPPWLQALVDGGRSALDLLDRALAEEGLRLPRVSDFAKAFRFVDLRADASADLAVARTRADLLSQVWPHLSVEHQAVGIVLDQLLQLVPSAGTAGQPWWEWRDFLSRPLVQARLLADEAFSQRTEALIVADASRRLEQDAERLWPAWVVEVSSNRWRAVSRGVGAASSSFVATRPDAEAAFHAKEWLATRRTDEWSEFIEQLTRSRTSEARRSLSRSIATALPTTVPAFIACAQRLADARWSYELLRSISAVSEIDTLRDIARWATPKQLAELDELSDAVWVDWMLREAPRETAWKSTECIDRMRTALPRQRLDAYTLRSRVGDDARLEWVLDAIADVLDEQTLYELAKVHAALVRRLVERTTLHVPSRDLAALVRAAPSETWTDATWRDGLDAMPTARAHAVVERVLPVLVEANAELRVLSSLFSSSAVRAWITWAESESRAIGRVVGAAHLPLLAAAAANSLEQAPTNQFGWVAALLRPAIERANLWSSANSEADLTRLFERVDDATRVALGSELVLQIRWSPRTFRSERILALIVAPLHQRLLDYDVFGYRWSWFSWDRARAFREWLTEHWIERSFPPRALVRATRGEVEFLGRILEWLRSERGKDKKRFRRELAESTLLEFPDRGPLCSLAQHILDD